MRYAFSPTSRPRAPVAPPLAVPWVHCVCGSLRSPSDPCPCRRLRVEPPAPSWRVQVGLLAVSVLVGTLSCWLYLAYWHGAAWRGVR